MTVKTKLLSASSIYFIILCVFLLMRIFNAFVNTGLDKTIYDIIFTVILQIGVLFLLPLWLFSMLRKQKPAQTFRDFQFNKISFLAILIAIGIGALCYFLNIAIASVWSGFISMFGYEHIPSTSSGTAGLIPGNSIWMFLINIAIVAILPAFGEEFTHRGMLLNGFSKMGVKKALIFSSLLFGLIHLNIDQSFYAFVLGLIIGLSVLVSGSIIPAMILHFMNNFINVYISHASKAGWIFGNFEETLNGWLGTANPFLVFVICLVALALAVAAVCGLFILLFKQTRYKTMQNMFKNIVTDDEIKADINALKDSGEKPAAEDIQNIKSRQQFNMRTINAMLGQYKVSVNDLVFGKEYKLEKNTYHENLFLYTSIGLAGLVTVFTLVWGML